ncbi:hypothetical protein D9758_005337 [Tetrapyrgos nigripes]|uniref:Alpha/beta-hydrolase n=1 Tax=Tetrapyrgos nigripes TaxID=182062 RepID=A0A8H5LQ51_9AGAR|nr:hypothetical protein D9758_005337 [Tetrapyrgos nigripes]
MLDFTLIVLLVAGFALAADVRRGTAHYREYFYVGYSYVPQSGNTSIADGQIYVERLSPASGTTQPYPILFIHGSGMTGTNFLNTPDGRPGWAEWFMENGYEVYLVDQAARGRSPWQQSVDGLQTTIDTLSVSQLFTATEVYDLWPNSTLHTQWPGNGTVGDGVFDQFYASMVPLLESDGESGTKNQHAFVALLDRIGEVILLTHSQAGLFTWPIADARPSLVKAIVTIEPGGPPFIGDTFSSNTPKHPWGLTEVPMTYDPPAASPSDLQTVNVTEGRLPGYTCILQQEPARKWVNLLDIPVLSITSETSWHGIFDDCTVDFMRQAGLTVDFVRLQDVDIHGNGHMMFMELNSDEIAEKVVGKWIAEKTKSAMLGSSRE